MASLDRTREYLVRLLTNDKGEITGIRGHSHPQLGTVVPLFSNEEELNKYLAVVDEKQAFLDMLERAPQHVASEDLTPGGAIYASVQELAQILKTYDVDYLVVDPLSPGAWQRYYPAPHKGQL